MKKKFLLVKVLKIARAKIKINCKIKLEKNRREKAVTVINSGLSSPRYFVFSFFFKKTNFPLKYKRLNKRQEKKSRNSFFRVKQSLYKIHHSNISFEASGVFQIAFVAYTHIQLAFYFTSLFDVPFFNFKSAFLITQLFFNFTLCENDFSWLFFFFPFLLTALLLIL